VDFQLGFRLRRRGQAVDCFGSATTGKYTAREKEQIANECTITMACKLRSDHRSHDGVNWKRRQDVRREKMAKRILSVRVSQVNVSPWATDPGPQQKKTLPVGEREREHEPGAPSERASGGLLLGVRPQPRGPRLSRNGHGMSYFGLLCGTESRHFLAATGTQQAHLDLISICILDSAVSPPRIKNLKCLSCRAESNKVKLVCRTGSKLRVHCYHFGPYRPGTLRVHFPSVV
jgi:hypothetical protein